MLLTHVLSVFSGDPNLIVYVSQTTVPGSDLAVEPIIPTVSEWGLIGMGVLTLVAGAVVFARRRRLAA